MKKDKDGNILIFCQPSTKSIVHLYKFLVPIFIIAPLILGIVVYFFGWQLDESIRTEFEFNNARGSLTIDYVKEYVDFILGIATLELS
jgi:Na+/glutamate symporter